MKNAFDITIKNKKCIWMSLIRLKLHIPPFPNSQLGYHISLLHSNTSCSILKTTFLDVPWSTKLALNANILLDWSWMYCYHRQIHLFLHRKKSVVKWTTLYKPLPWFVIIQPSTRIALVQLKGATKMIGNFVFQLLEGST